MSNCFVISHDNSLPGSSVHGFSQARILELPFLSPGALPHPGMEPVSPALAGGFFTIEPPGKPIRYICIYTYTCMYIYDISILT